MERPVKGDLVTLAFPFRDGIRVMNRPALVIAIPDNDQAVLCQVTSSTDSKPFSLTIQAADFQFGRLRKVSRVRTDIILSFDIAKISKIIGRVTPDFFDRVVHELNEMIRQS